MAGGTEKAGNRITIGGQLTVNRIGYGAMKRTGDHVWGEYPDREGGIAAESIDLTDDEFASITAISPEA